MSKLPRDCFVCLLVTVATGMFPAAKVQAGELEVLHYWTSGGEANAVIGLRAMMLSKGHRWKDFAVTGGGGETATTLLKARVASGNPPAAAQTKGPAIREWAATGVLANIDDVAKAEKWDELLPRAVSDLMKYKGNYVAVPVDVHRVNWLWVNADALKKAGASVPTSWDEFFATAEALKRAGIIPVAHGGQSWQGFTTFESVALGVGGAEFYKQAFVRLDEAALTGATMERVLTTFKRIKSYTDRNANGRDWNLATAMVVNGEAGMQLMGDWTKVEFVAAGKASGKDFICTAAPGAAAAYSFDIDSFVMFRVKGAEQVKAQKDFAAAIMAPAFQESFNLSKGSVPVRLNMPMNNFDACARQSSADFLASAKAGTLVPSLAHGMATSPAVESAMKDVIDGFWLAERMSAKEAMAQLAVAARAR